MNGRRILIIIIAFLAFILSFRIASKVFKTKELVSEKIIPVVVKNPTIGNIEETVTLLADVKAKTEVAVRPRIAGRVQEIYVEEGQYVEKGDPLLSYVQGIKNDDDLYSDMVVTAPISGIIGMKLVKEGEQVVSQVGGLVNPVFMIYDISQLKIYSSVPEKYYSYIKIGMPVKLVFDAFPDETFIGRISNIRPVIDPATRTTQIEIVLPNYQNKLRPGMFAKAQISLRQAKNALLIPFDSILGDQEKYVFVVENGIAKKIPVSIGIQEGNDVQITKGLTKDHKVIVIGQRVVSDGAKVEEMEK